MRYNSQIDLRRFTPTRIIVALACYAATYFIVAIWNSYAFFWPKYWIINPVAFIIGYLYFYRMWFHSQERISPKQWLIISVLAVFSGWFTSLVPFSWEIARAAFA